MGHFKTNLRLKLLLLRWNLLDHLVRVCSLEVPVPGVIECHGNQEIAPRVERAERITGVKGWITSVLAILLLQTLF